MTEISTVDLVFNDLEDAFHDLSAESVSPKQIRRNFVRFIDHTQKLTATMRTDYHARTGKKWAANTFTGWNDLTELFKELRNDDEHEYPVSIVVHDREYYEIFPGGSRVMIEGTWDMSLETQLADKPPEGMQLIYEEQTIPSVKTEYEFHLWPRTQKVEQLLTRIGDSDVRSLSKKCFEVLSDYYQYYQNQVKKNRREH